MREDPTVDVRHLISKINEHLAAPEAPRRFYSTELMTSAEVDAVGSPARVPVKSQVPVQSPHEPWRKTGSGPRES